MAEPEPRLPRRLPAELPVERHELDTAYHRIHRSAHDALWFGPAPGGPPLGRFDDPDGGAFRTLYASTGPEGAFAETFLRDRAPVRLLSVRAVQERRISELMTLTRLTLAQLHGPGLARLGADSGVASGPYRISRAWARALWVHPAEVDGIIYRARLDDQTHSVAVFDRAAGRLRLADGPRPLSTAFLARMAERYGFALVS